MLLVVDVEKEKERERVIYDILEQYNLLTDKQRNQFIVSIRNNGKNMKIAGFIKWKLQMRWKQ